MHTNRLANESSPYLLQHAHNPVDWFPWGSEAIEKARKEDKPIFLSIGYATCHWCHVMERESFENEAIAQILNEHFVSIKVDREQRPDIDRIYMAAVQLLTGHGGWPLSAWLNHDLEPFFGGTYFPPENRHGRMGFPNLLEQIHHVWKNQRDDVARQAGELGNAIRNQSKTIAEINQPFSHAQLLERAGQALLIDYDSENGGFGSAPKFPRPATPLYLLRYAERFGNHAARQAVLHTCHAMAQGGMNDQLGGGFHRYSVDEQWLVPHFEKMLYDQAQLMWLYTEAWQISRNHALLQTVEEIHRYLARDMTHPQGGFFSAEDADSEGREGIFYVWTRKQIDELLSPEDAEWIATVYGISREGNFLDHSDPNPLPGLNVLSMVKAPEPSEEARLKTIKQTLFNHREKRIRPLRDDKIQASWNGMAISSYARAAAATGNGDYMTMAQRAWQFIRDHQTDPNTNGLLHSWREGKIQSDAFLEDYACVTQGLIDLYQAGLDGDHLKSATKLADQMIARFYDETHGGFWGSDGTDSTVLARMKEDYDGAEPSGNSIAIYALLQLAELTNNQQYRHAAEKSLLYLTATIARMPRAVPHLCTALDFMEGEVVHVLLFGNSQEPAFRELHQAALQVYHPRKIVNHATLDHPSTFCAEAAKKEPGIIAQVCVGQVCKLPTKDAAALRQFLEPAGNLAKEQ